MDARAMNESEEMATILFQLDQHSLSVLRECVSHRLETWPGGDPEQQEDLMALKTMLFAAGLEFQFDD